MLLPVETVQIFLMNEGLLVNVDGIFGPQTSSAARSWLTTHNIRTMGWPDSRVEVAIGQVILKTKGFDPGPIDGYIGHLTKAAVGKAGLSQPQPATSLGVGLNPIVVDLSHHNTITSWQQVRNCGIAGVIHKATEGIGYVDQSFRTRVPMILETGMLLGAYHFANGSDVAKQVSHFISTVEKAVGEDAMKLTLLALDWEDDPNGNTMTLSQAVSFVQLVAKSTGQRPVVYSGNLIKEKTGKRGDPILCSHRLWLAQYSAKPVLPPGFTDYFLWQYSGDGRGLKPHGVPGITGDVDMNHYQGTSEQLKMQWVVEQK